MHLKQKSYYCTNLGKAYAFLFGPCTTGLQHRIEAKAKYESNIKGDPIKLLETIKENSLSFNDKKKANIVTIDAIMNLMTTRQRDDEDLTEYTKRFKAVRDLCKEKYGGYLKSQCSPKKSPHGALIKKPATRQWMPVSYPSCISRIWIKQSMVHRQKTLPQVRRMSTQFTSRMHNIFCPSTTSMTKLIMISRRSNETIMTNITCPQRMTIVQLLRMYLIQWKCPSHRWKDNLTSVAPRVTYDTFVSKIPIAPCYCQMMG